MARRARTSPASRLEEAGGAGEGQVTRAKWVIYSRFSPSATTNLNILRAPRLLRPAPFQSGKVSGESSDPGREYSGKDCSIRILR